MGWDRYGYSNNNPVLYTDPSGHFPFLLVPAIVTVAIIGSALLSGCTAPPESVQSVNQEKVKELGRQLAVMSWKEPTKRDYNQAIKLAIDAYHLDTSNAKEIAFDFQDKIPDGQGAGATMPDGRILLNQSAFSTPGELGSIIDHELVHANQIAGNRSHYQVNDPYLRNQTQLLNEYEAYTWQINRSAHFGLNTTEDLVYWMEWREWYYSQMDEETKKLAEKYKEIPPFPE